MGGSMKVHQFARGLFWEHEPSLSLGCKRLRPLAPKLHHHHHHHQQHHNSGDTAPVTADVTPFDLNSFIRPESGPRKLGSPDDKREPNQVDTHPGGTRWNPTQEQIGILEMLYRGGMRTPNAQQIEQITEQLSKYGKIEGKNVFYWFQNHKARERQKQKRSNTPRSMSSAPVAATAAPTTTTTMITITNPITQDHLRGSELMMIRREIEDSPYKRKCRSWTFECLQEEENKLYCRSEEETEAGTGTGDRTTLELFPLHPENMMR